MRTFLSAVAWAMCFGTLAAHAADIEFECDPTTFEQPVSDHQGSKRHFTIEGQPNLNSPLYEGLWPMTLDAFRRNGQRLYMDAKSSFPVPLIPHSHPTIDGPARVPAGMVFASDDDDLRRFRINNLFSFYDSPLCEGLYPMTIEAFKRADEPKYQEVPTFCIASNH